MRWPASAGPATTGSGAPARRPRRRPPCAIACRLWRWRIATTATAASRIALGLWRARRSDRIEAALLASYLERARGTGERRNLGLAVIRDAHGPRALDTLLRYRGSAHAELFRALGALKALQAEAADAGQEPLPAAAARLLSPPDETNPRPAAGLSFDPVDARGARREG